MTSLSGNAKCTSENSPQRWGVPRGSHSRWIWGLCLSLIVFDNHFVESLWHHMMAAVIVHCYLRQGGCFCGLSLCLQAIRNFVNEFWWIRWRGRTWPRKEVMRFWSPSGFFHGFWQWCSSRDQGLEILVSITTLESWDASRTKNSLRFGLVKKSLNWSWISRLFARTYYCIFWEQLTSYGVK